MPKPFASLMLLAFALILPTAAYAQLDSVEINEATSAILDAGPTATQIGRLHHVPSVGVIDLAGGFVSPFSHRGEQISTLEILAERNSNGVNKLRHALSANPVTRRTMADHGVDAKHVIGVSIGGTGSLRFFVE